MEGACSLSGLKMGLSKIHYYISIVSSLHKYLLQEVFWLFVVTPTFLEIYDLIIFVHVSYVCIVQAIYWQLFALI